MDTESLKGLTWMWVLRKARSCRSGGKELAGLPGAGRPGTLPADLQRVKPRWVRTEPREQRPGAQSCFYYGFEMFLLLNVLSFFLPACLPFGPLAV